MNVTTKEYGVAIERANYWKFRAHVAESLAQYFNAIFVPGSSFAKPEDLRHEIDLQTDRLMQYHEDGITFMKDAHARGVRTSRREP